MNPDMLLPVITSLGWLILCGAALASYRLKWSQVLKMSLTWLAIFIGLFLIVEWYLMAQTAAGSLV